MPFLSRAALSASSILEPRIGFQHEYDLLIQELDELKREEMSAFAVQVIDLYQQQLQDLYTAYHEQGLSPNTNLQTTDGLRTYTASMVFSYQLSEKIREIDQGERSDAELSELLERIPADILYYYPSSLLDEQFQSDMRQLSQMLEQGYDPEQIIREQITSLRQSIENCEREGNEEEVEYLRNKLEQKEYRLSVGDMILGTGKAQPVTSSRHIKRALSRWNGKRITVLETRNFFTLIWRLRRKKSALVPLTECWSNFANRRAISNVRSDGILHQ